MNIHLAALKACGVLLRPFHYRGMWQVANALGQVFPSDGYKLLDDGERRFKIYLGDPFWAKYAVVGFCYEPEVEKALAQVLTPDSIFLDCGANNGYWSIYAATKIHDPKRIIAVEAGASNFQRLKENWELNYRSFTLMQKAIHSSSGKTLRFRTHPVRHGANTVAFDELPDGYHEETVKSITIDDILQGMDGPVVIKLDLEGVELAALAGAKETIARGATLIYEDHPKATDCLTTSYLVDQLHLKPWFLPRDGSAPIRIVSVEQLQKIKTRRNCGENLLCRLRANI